MPYSNFQRLLPNDWSFQDVNGRIHVYNELEMLVASGRDFAEVIYYLNFSL